MVRHQNTLAMSLDPSLGKTILQGKEAEETQDKHGRRTGIDFARTFGQRCPEEDILSEEEYVSY